MSDGFTLNEDCPALQVLDQVADAIIEDGKAAGKWAQLLTQVQTRQKSRPYYAKDDDYPSRRTVTLDGHARRPSLVEKLRGLTPMPPIVQISWRSDTRLQVLGWTSEDSTHEAEILISDSGIGDAVARTLTEVETAFRSLDASKSEAIKIHDAPAELAGIMSQGKFADMANDQASRTIRF